VDGKLVDGSCRTHTHDVGIESDEDMTHIEIYHGTPVDESCHTHINTHTHIIQAVPLVSRI